MFNKMTLKSIFLLYVKYCRKSKLTWEMLGSCKCGWNLFSSTKVSFNFSIKGWIASGWPWSIPVMSLRWTPVTPQEWPNIGLLSAKYK